MLAGVQGYTHAQKHKLTFPSYPKKSFHPLLDVLYMYKKKQVNWGNYGHFSIIYVPHSCGKLAR